MGFTTPDGLVIDFDEFDVETTLKICLKVTRENGCGDVLLVFSSWKGQITLDGSKAIHTHSVFGASMEHKKIQKILKQLVKMRIIQDMFRFFNERERELTIRISPKKMNRPAPKPYLYVRIDGQREVIDNYLRQASIANRIYSEVYGMEVYAK
jgi:hypothetical protein